MVQYVGKRLKNSNHHIKDFENHEHEIWIATYANIKNPKPQDVSICENLLIAILYQKKVGEKCLENKTNYRAPESSVCIINEWFTKGGKKRCRQAQGSPAKVMPDVIVYDNENKEVKYADSLSRLGVLE